MRTHLVLSGLFSAALAFAPQIAHATPTTSTVDNAIAALSSSVTTTSHPEALRKAIQAYYNFKTAHPDQVRNPYFYFVDYGLSKRTPPESSGVRLVVTTEIRNRTER